MHKLRITVPECRDTRGVGVPAEQLLAALDLARGELAERRRPVLG